MSETTKVYRRRYLRLELDKSKVFSDDPGADTPAMVYYDGPLGLFWATYWCAKGEAELLNCWGKVYQLTEKQLEWLNSLESEVDKFLYGER